MIRLHFYLEKRFTGQEASIQRECPVILSVSYSSGRIKVYTGRKVAENEWDKTRERVKPLYAKADEMNQYLDNLSDRVLSFFSEAEAGPGIPGPAWLRPELRRLVKHSVPTLTGLVLRFIDRNHSGWSLSTYRKMKTFHAQLLSFSMEKHALIPAGKVNEVFIEDLVHFYRDKGLKDTSIRKNIDLLKWVMNWGTREGILHNPDFRKIRFIPESASHSETLLFLKWEELMQFYLFSNLTKKEMWARDMFCFIAFTGTRFSHLLSVKKEQWKGKYLEMGHNKKWSIILNRFSLEILEKYRNRYYRNNTLFPSMTLVTFQKYVRSAAYKAGLGRACQTYPASSPVPLHSLISAKSAINTYYAILVTLDIHQNPVHSYSTDSVRAKIVESSGSLKLAELKQLTTSDYLYESLRNTESGH